MECRVQQGSSHIPHYVDGDPEIISMGANTDSSH
jgi:hypothetical protein